MDSWHGLDNFFDFVFDSPLVTRKTQGHEIACPTREVYIKGPGMIFKGNPKRYLTEIQILVTG